MNEIDFRKATHEDLLNFAMNLLRERKIDHPGDYESRIAYFSTATQVGIGWRASESSDRLAHEIDQARSAVGRGLEKLTLAIADAANKSDVASRRMETESGRIVRATWGLVIATAVLAAATIGLVIYTRQLVRVEAHSTPTSVQQPQATGK